MCTQVPPPTQSVDDEPNEPRQWLQTWVLRSIRAFQTTATTTVATAAELPDGNRRQQQQQQQQPPPLQPGPNPLPLGQYHYQCESRQHESRPWGYARQTGVECPDPCYERKRKRKRALSIVPLSFSTSL
jgi:hypothetical protein